MKPKHQRLLFVSFSLVSIVAAVLLMLRAFSENLVFFYAPSDIAAQSVDGEKLIRVGGLVESGSVAQDGQQMRFRVTDGNAVLSVAYTGMPPALFREGQGVIAEGYLRGGQLEAMRILTKHDEKYMPPEVVDALKKSGRWREGEQ